MPDSVAWETNGLRWSLVLDKTGSDKKSSAYGSSKEDSSRGVVVRTMTPLARSRRPGACNDDDNDMPYGSSNKK